MPVFPKGSQCVALLALVGAGFGTSKANADIPALALNWWVNGDLVYGGLPSGTALPNGMFSFAGGYTDWGPPQGQGPGTGAQLTWSLTADPDPLISGNLTVFNPFNSTIDVVLQVILPIAPSLTPASALSGSAAIGLTTDAGGGELHSLLGTPVWQGLIDGAAVGASASMFFADHSQLHGGFGSSGVSSDFGLPSAVLGPAALASIGITISFSITPLDQASITSVFFAGAIPGPGALMVIVAGLVTLRRRRRA